jgi:ABC-2 type transport system permease protein
MSTLAGTGRLWRLAARADRLRVAVWLVGVVALVVVSAVSVVGLYGTPAELAGYVALVGDNATMKAVNGPGLGLASPTVGAVFTNETLVWAALSVAVMSVLLTVRHTRGEEDDERVELLRARMVGRHAPLAATVLHVGSVNVVVAVGCVVGVVAVGLPVVGSAAFSLAMVGTGLAATGAALVAAQVMGTSRGATGLSLAVVGAWYALRAAGDVSGSWPSWVSPLGWAHRVRPYAGERWWVLALHLALAATLAVGAVAVFDRRDLGSGLLAQRAGRARGPRSLRGPAGLAWRLQRGQVLAWSVGLAVLGAVYGSVGRDVERMFADNPDLERFIALQGGASVVDSYVSYTLLLGAMMAGGFAIAAVLRLRTEEAAGRAELVLSAPVARWRWMGAFLAVSIAGSAVVLLASGLGTGAGLAASMGRSSELARSAGASLSLLPAVAVLAVVAALVVAALPRFAALAWGPLVFVVLVGLFADVFELPAWVRSLSPMEHVSGPPATGPHVVAMVVLAASALAGSVLAMAGLGRRDVPVA